ncbi:hypothetical protein HOP50_16g78870 [Chloropicon primus]|uniref:Uncharacterized protein n=1 Tax=Chloropicon primus TaxID=1764295 RepID=A0A5B8MXL1_9CHLO|nr:hypothetical protein A3770_16p78570 [Chloropicon primus]UPR04545.1 hypothetical protein HOP50_16g78870 [Chloropicon primus]|mmetsp:Transcript_14031/g.39697  ORF Transcript_14031/g.39697 Transcript_14031/m.39697 type:complete len:372 (-) Transcript_14031:192-1307(-)|eukprot:QDZ25339.1 hypothetical protein A3770_16p78570 [Chloropicon primus]
MAQALAVASTAFSLVNNTKKAVDVFRSLKEAPALSTASFLKKLVLGSIPTLTIAKSLANRSEGVEILSPALDLFAETLEECTTILDGFKAFRDDQEEGEEQETWNKWLQKKNGKDALLSVCTRVQQSQQLLTMCLTSLQFSCPGLRIDQPFYFQPSVVSKAHDFLLEFEFGRMASQTLAFAMLARRTRGSTVKSSAQTVWEHLYYCRVLLVIGDGKRCTLQFPRLTKRPTGLGASQGEGSDDEEEDFSRDLETFAIDRGTRFFRYTKTEMRGLDVLFLEDKHDLVYQLDNYLIHFERSGNVSAELFEAIICLCKLKDGKNFLSKVLSLDNPADVLEVKGELSEVGPYWEEPNAEKAKEHEIYEKLAQMNVK